MARVTAHPLPSKSALHDRFEPGDFLDCFAVAATASPREAAEIITSFPGWAQALVQLRRAVTAPFGLKNDPPADAKDVIGIFPVESESARELIAGFDDKHLNFRISVMQEDGLLTLATWVRPHNFGGRIYLKTIMPFHILIARDALARVAKLDAGQDAEGALGTR